ncbi:MAG: caspase family protein [Chitinophagales bacterium]|nr:caspase family protein [Chitinophagales bacterium]
MNIKTLLLGCTLVLNLTILAQGKGYALLVGANKTFKPQKYDSASVAKAADDALLIQHILVQSGFYQQDVKLLSDATATNGNIIKELKAVVKKLKKGDMFVFYFSGHGDTIPDFNHDELPYTFDQQLILADKPLVDDELFEIFKQLKDSVRVVFISDACFSGHMYKWQLMYAKRQRFRSMAFLSAESALNNESGCYVQTDSAAFNMMYVGAVDRDATSEPYPDGSGRLTRWINDAWQYLKGRSLLHTLSMLEFFRQACYSSSETIVTIVSNSSRDVFGNSPLFKL